MPQFTGYRFGFGRRKKIVRPPRYGAQFQNANATSINTSSAISGTANYGVSFTYEGFEIFAYGNFTSSDIQSTINFYTGPSTPAPLSPNVSGLKEYKLHRYPNSASTGSVIKFTGQNGIDNHIIHVRGTGDTQGYVNGTCPNWAPLDPAGEFTLLAKQTFREGGISGVFSGNTTAIDNDAPTRARVKLLAGSGGAGTPSTAGRAGGTSGGSGGRVSTSPNPEYRPTGAGGGGGGSATGAGGGGAGFPNDERRGNPGNGFQGGAGNGGSGYDGWYGGGSGGYDAGNNTGYGQGGGGSSRVDPSLTGTNSYYPSAEPLSSTYWYLNVPTWANGSMIIGYKAS
jgi:hypothetical protein